MVLQKGALKNSLHIQKLLPWKVEHPETGPGLHVPSKDSNLVTEPCQGTVVWDHKHLVHMNQELTEALQPYNRPMDQHIVQAKELKGTALNKMDVQMLAWIRQSVEDDGIYKLYQICTAPFSNSRSILSHLVVMDIHKYLVARCSMIHPHVLDGETCRMHQTYRCLFLNNTGKEALLVALGKLLLLRFLQLLQPSYYDLEGDYICTCYHIHMSQFSYSKHNPPFQVALDKTLLFRPTTPTASSILQVPFQAPAVSIQIVGYDPSVTRFFPCSVRTAPFLFRFSSSYLQELKTISMESTQNHETKHSSD